MTNPSRLTIRYWKSDQFYVGQMVEIPAVMSQGATLQELESNIRDAYDLVKGGQHENDHPSEFIDLHFMRTTQPQFDTD